MPIAPDIDHLRGWIGRQQRDSDTITPALVKRLRATLSGFTELAGDADAAPPPGIHWCLAPPAVTHRELGVDGHPTTGGFLPPVPLSRRMWASSRMQFLRAFAADIPLEKVSTIAEVVLKQSAASGPLVFVDIDHEYTQAGAALLCERQTLVYRQPSLATQPSSVQQAATPPRSAARSLPVTPDSRLLFRYSALTFNGHRIHYDQRYATETEGYPALVVHGPLIATLLMNLAQAGHPQTPLQAFEFRAVAPAFVDEALQLTMHIDETAHAADATCQLEASNPRGVVTMVARAQFGGGSNL